MFCVIFIPFSHFILFFCSNLFRIVADPVNTATASQCEDYPLDDANNFGNKQGKRSAPKRKMPGDENIALLGQGRGIEAKRIS